MSNIHIYIKEPENKDPYHLSIEETQQLTNGSCDSIIFQEINYIDMEDIQKLFLLINEKLAYGGSCFCQFNHMESIISDYNFNKINEEKLNNQIFRGKRNLLSETTMVAIIKSTGFVVKNITYDEYLAKLEIVKTNE